MTSYDVNAPAKEISLKGIVTRVNDFFFAKVDATGFGLMRIAWATTALFSTWLRWPDLKWYFTDEGILPIASVPKNLSQIDGFSIFKWVETEQQMMVVFTVLVVTLLLTLIGYKSRWMVLISLIILTSQHNRNFLILNGGDRMIRIAGFCVLICPYIDHFSVDRLRLQYRNWKEKRELLPTQQISIWPYRVLLWQMIFAYFTVGWSKAVVDVWQAGTALSVVFHHANYVRYSRTVMDAWSLFSPFLSWWTLAVEIGWIALLIPRRWTHAFLPNALRKHSLKRILLFNGILLHGGIFLFMEVGTFSWGMLTTYFGLLLREDFDVIKKFFNRKWSGRIAVLFDGQCRLCQRSMFGLHLVDWLGRLTDVDFRDGAARNAVAPELTEDTLDRAMHIKMPDGTTYKGFDAFRAMAWHLPALWLLAPLLYIPGVPPIGRKVYAGIAERRNSCAGGACKITP